MITLISNLMSLSLFWPRHTIHVCSARPRILAPATVGRAFARRSIFKLFAGRSRKENNEEKVPTLADDNLFHPFSESPFPVVRARSDAIRSMAPCPVCASSSGHSHVPPPRAVKFECLNCGWPTHCSEEHWKVDENHTKYCSRLREANEDEHDLRRGRRMLEFELPGTFCLP